MAIIISLRFMDVLTQGQLSFTLPSLTLLLHSLVLPFFFFYLNDSCCFDCNTKIY